MKVTSGLLLASMASFGVPLHGQAAAPPANVAFPSPERTRLAKQLLEATNARANAKALVDKLLSPAIGDLKLDYPESGIAEWGRRYADRQAEAQYQQMLASYAQTDVQQLRSMVASITRASGKSALVALKSGDLSGQAALLDAIDQTNTSGMRHDARLEVLKGTCAQIACPRAAQREIAPTNVGK